MLRLKGKGTSHPDHALTALGLMLFTAPLATLRYWCPIAKARRIPAGVGRMALGFVVVVTTAAMISLGVALSSVAMRRTAWLSASAVRSDRRRVHWTTARDVCDRPVRFNVPWN